MFKSEPFIYSHSLLSPAPRKNVYIFLFVILVNRTTLSIQSCNLETKGYTQLAISLYFTLIYQFLMETVLDWSIADEVEGSKWIWFIFLSHQDLLTYQM